MQCKSAWSEAWLSKGSTKGVVGTGAHVGRSLERIRCLRWLNGVERLVVLMAEGGKDFKWICSGRILRCLYSISGLIQIRSLLILHALEVVEWYGARLLLIKKSACVRSNPFLSLLLGLSLSQDLNSLQ